MRKKVIIFYLLLISLISLGFKLLVTDFSIPVNSDNLEYALFAVAHTNGDFSQSSHRGMGWSLFTSAFFGLINSENFLDYSITIKSLSIIIGISSIPMIYLIGRKYFDHRYSLVLASLFAFEPHLNYNSTLGLTEPIVILSILGTFYFVLNRNTRLIIFSLLLAGIAYWMRINGIWVFLVISLIYFIIQKKSWKFIGHYSIGVGVFLLIISPILIERNEEFGDPFYSVYKDTIFAGDFESMVSAIGTGERISVFDYVEKNGIFSFFNTYIIIGLFNTLTVTSSLTLPYLFLLIPFGILFSFRAFDQNTNFIKSNWIFILTSIGFLIFIMAIVPDRRFVLHLLPFLMIFYVITIQRVVEYGLSTFSFSRKQKDVFLIGVLLTIIILSTFVIIRYVPDSELENEKLEFSKFAIDNLDGVILREYGGTLDYVKYLAIEKSFKNYKIGSNILQNSDILLETNSSPKGETVYELIKDGEKYDLKYIISKQNPSSINPFMDELYYDYEKYHYIEKFFDSDDYDFKKLKIKIFEINYDKFNNLSDE